MLQNFQQQPVQAEPAPQPDAPAVPHSDTPSVAPVFSNALPPHALQADQQRAAFDKVSLASLSFTTFASMLKFKNRPPP